MPTRKAIALPLFFFTLFFSVQFATVLGWTAEEQEIAVQKPPAIDHGYVASTDAIMVQMKPTTLQSVDHIFATEPEMSIPDAILSVSQVSEVAWQPVAPIYRMALTTGSDPDAVIARLNQHPDVLVAEPDYLAHLIATPDDAHYGSQWGLAQIGAETAWDVTTGAADVVVAVIDSGIDMDHPDLVNQLWINPGEIAGNGLDDDNNGYVDDIHGWNMADGNATLADSTGHGTEVAGIIGAESNNATGVAGVCWQCRLMILKVTQTGGVANYSDIAEAVYYAAQKGADVINLSLGGYSNSVILGNAIATAAETAVVIGGVGNDDSSELFYPAAYAEALAIAGTDNLDQKVASSNYGAWVDLAAPGVNIMTTLDGGSYGTTSGTSMAAPFASGLAALLRSANPDWSPQTVLAQMLHTAEDIDGLNPSLEGLLGNGRIAAGQSLTVSPQPLLTVVSRQVNGDANGRPQPGESIALAVELYNDWGPVDNLQATLTTTDSHATVTSPTAAYGTIGTLATGTAAAPFEIDVSASAPYSHDIVFQMALSGDGGFAATLPVTVTTASSVITVPATITTQTWTNDHVYVINKDTGIPPGETLTIEPGTTVLFDGYYSLTVMGELVADGLPDSPIVFTINPAKVDVSWNQLIFEDSSTDAVVDANQDYVSGSIMRHVEISEGLQVYLHYASPYLAHNVFDVKLTAAFVTAGLVLTDNEFNSVSVGLDNYSSQEDFYISRNLFNDSPLKVWGPSIISQNRFIKQTPFDPSDGVTWEEGCITVYEGTEVTKNSIDACPISSIFVIKGTPLLAQNSIIDSQGAAIYIYSGTPVINQNNIWPAAGQYGVHNTTNNSIEAIGNWWGGDGTVADMIYDGADEFGLGMVDASAPLTQPDQDAPPFIQSVTISPDTTLGIEKGVFTVQYSKPMAPAGQPSLTFVNAKSGTIEEFTVDDIGFSLGVGDLEFDIDGSVWAVSYSAENGYLLGHYDGNGWEVFVAKSIGLPDARSMELEIDTQGKQWIVTREGIYHNVGNGWERSDKLGEMSDWPIYDIAVDAQGVAWFAAEDGIWRHKDSRWEKLLDTSFPVEWYDNLAIDTTGVVWASSTYGYKIARFDGQTWQEFTTSDLGVNGVFSDIVVNHANTVLVWVAYENVLLKYDGTTWSEYPVDPSITGELSLELAPDGSVWIVSSNNVFQLFDNGEVITHPYLAIDPGSLIRISPQGDIWVNSPYSPSNDIVLRIFYRDFPAYEIMGDEIWTNEFNWQASYNFTSQILRGTYLFSADGGVDANGMVAISSDPIPFVVDYAGEIADQQTPPAPPTVLAGGVDADASSLTAFWLNTDPDQPVVAYRYAIGSYAGGADVINWTETSDTTVQLSGLGLVPDHQYWVAVQARNAGGLWSAASYASFRPGVEMPQVYLPVILR